jgi:hypothetical protein
MEHICESKESQVVSTGISYYFDKTHFMTNGEADLVFSTRYCVSASLMPVHSFMNSVVMPHLANDATDRTTGPS